MEDIEYDIQESLDAIHNTAMEGVKNINNIVIDGCENLRKELKETID